MIAYRGAVVESGAITAIDFMQEAIRLATVSMRQGQGGPFGAIVVKEGRVVGRGWNQVTAGNDPTAHAEVVAIREACRELQDFRLNRCTLYTSCEPCPMCFGAIYWARLETVYYAATREDAARAGFDDLFIHQELALPPLERRIRMEQLGIQEARQLLEEWKQKPDKITY